MISTCVKFSASILHCTITVFISLLHFNIIVYSTNWFCCIEAWYVLVSKRQVLSLVWRSSGDIFTSCLTVCGFVPESVCSSQTDWLLSVSRASRRNESVSKSLIILQICICKKCQILPSFWSSGVHFSLFPLLFRICPSEGCEYCGPHCK